MTLQNVRRSLKLAETAVLVFVAYIVVVAPALLLRGDARGLKEEVAGIIGLGFWTLAVVVAWVSITGSGPATSNPLV